MVYYWCTFKLNQMKGGDNMAYDVRCIWCDKRMHGLKHVLAHCQTRPDKYQHQITPLGFLALLADDNPVLRVISNNKQ